VTVAHEIRGRLHAARLHLTYLERAFTSPGDDPEIVEAVKAAIEELRALEHLVLEHLALTEKPATGAGA
jgi:signal transduction histidine kinase